MAVPKRKVSKARRDTRRHNNTHLDAPTLVTCPNCKQLVLAHHVCKACGFYRGKKILNVEEAK